MHPLVAAVEDSEDVSYVLSSDLRLLYTNRGWRSFAEQNGGLDGLARWPAGAPIDEVMPMALRDFYRRAYRFVLRSGQCWEHAFECSSPTRQRKFRMFAYPLDAGRLLVVNSLDVEIAHPETDHQANEHYRVDGVIRMCANCRRTFDPATLRWDWVSAYVSTLPRDT